MISQITIRTATFEDTDSVTTFRIQQYRTAKEFEILDLAALAQQRGKVLIAEYQGNIVSTMQIEIVETLEAFKRLDLDITDDIGFTAFPTLYLSKGATAKDFRNTGLNSMLRIESLKYAIEHELRSLSGIAYDNAPRLHLLERIGYTSVVIPHRDATYSKPKGNMLFLTLLSEQFEQALTMLYDEVSATPKSK